MRYSVIAVAAGAVLLLGGCGSLTKQQTYVGGGAALGATVGALVTGGTGTLQGAAIGAAVGGAGGYVVEKLTRR